MKSTIVSILVLFGSLSIHANEKNCENSLLKMEELIRKQSKSTKIISRWLTDLSQKLNTLGTEVKTTARNASRAGGVVNTSSLILAGSYLQNTSSIIQDSSYEVDDASNIFETKANKILVELVDCLK